MIQAFIENISPSFKGDIYTGEAMRALYATDASAYRELPAAVLRPKDEEDVQLVVKQAYHEGIPLIPRGAGTSLAGQVVGSGVVVDMSKYFTRVLHLDTEKASVLVQPGLILDELNRYLKPHGLFFGPETSTASRCNIGGMLGNNSCGAHSLIYGSTRDHTLSVKGFLSDGSPVTFGPLTKDEFINKTKLQGLEGEIFRHIEAVLSREENRKEINLQFPDKALERRNTGYALDILLDNEVFGDSDKLFNFSKLIAGSEGTLMFITAIELHLVPLPPPVKGLVCVHLQSVEEALHANLVALKTHPDSIELMDKAIMDLTRTNKRQNANRFFVKGDPGAILIVEYSAPHIDRIKAKATQLEETLRRAGYGYHFPLITGKDIPRVWALRKAGLGVLSNMPGDAKPAPVIEDTAVLPEKLPQYIADFNKILDMHRLKCVYYAHIATGELHLRPVLNLKNPEHVKLFRTIAYESAVLVKKYQGSLSGEHGDGRLRGEFIPLMVGKHVYQLFKELKKTWDPKNILNPGKITDTPPIDTSLRYENLQAPPQINTVFDFSASGGFLAAVEKCNGSGDCRKPASAGGVMCPSYMATLDEQNTTRARANTLREYISRKPKTNPLNHSEIYESLDLCLSCKGCKTECPSNVDMTKFKAEFLQHWYDLHGIPRRTRLIAYINSFNRLGSLWPAFYNFFLANKTLSGWFKKFIGFAPKRSIPLLYRFTLKAWLKAHPQNPVDAKGQLYLFVDEFTNYNDVETGIATVKLLQRLGYRVLLAQHDLSGRTFLSKGLLRKAKSIAENNVRSLAPLVNDDTPLVGIEPSAILGFRDEFPELVDASLRNAARHLARHSFMVDEFIAAEYDKGRISPDAFTHKAAHIKVHGHCHQKALASTAPTLKALSIPLHYTVEEIPSGCCGMAGSFGYEKEHYELSQKVGELVLFPEVRKSSDADIIAAPGTSCRHQIKDGTGRKALHPMLILYNALIDE